MERNKYIFKQNKKDFYDANGLKTEVLTERTFEKAFNEFGVSLLQYIQRTKLVLVDGKYWEDFETGDSYTNAELVFYFSKLNSLNETEVTKTN